MGSKLAESLGALPIFGARTLRYERWALSRRKFTIFVPYIRTNPILSFWPMMRVGERLLGK
jgi:hypothetical protein